MWEILMREIVPSAKEQTPPRDNPPCGLHGETAWTYKESTSFSGTENLYSFKTLPFLWGWLYTRLYSDVHSTANAQKAEADPSGSPCTLFSNPRLCS